MCLFISWIEMSNGDIKFLTGKQVFDTLRGKKLQREIDKPDLIGHQAIRHYYRIPKGMGINGECSNFSTPTNFPIEIAQAIREGDILRLSDHSIYIYAKQLLTVVANKMWGEAIAPAYKAREESKVLVDKAYKGAMTLAYKAREESKVLVDKAWEEAMIAAFKIIFAIPENRNPVWR